jgi:SAM-dependent methyltransferase
VDISEEAIRLAQEQAAHLGVKLHAVLKRADEFDYGRNQWDLVIGIFMHGIFSRNAARIAEGLKPGGLVVVEGFHADASQAGKLGYQSDEFLRAFDRLRIIQYQELTAPADWSGGRPQPLARLVARKE